MLLACLPPDAENDPVWLDSQGLPKRRTLYELG